MKNINKLVFCLTFLFVLTSFAYTEILIAKKRKKEKYRTTDECARSKQYYDLAEKLQKEFNFTETLRFYRLATDAGHLGALKTIGYYCEYGIGGVKEDKNEAIKWYRLVAEQGNEYAIERLKELGE